MADLDTNEGSGHPESKRARVEGTEDDATMTNRETLPGSCGQPGSESCSAAQTIASLKVTIQQSSESREFRHADRTADTQTGGLHCHVCDVTCRSLQVFQEHMAGSEHLTKLKDITQSVYIGRHTLQDRGLQPDLQRWCDICQTHFSGDVIVHRQTKQHKTCKRLSRPFCPVCQRHFRTPRKFVEHMKSAEHKQQVHLEEVQKEELITVDAVGCFKVEEEAAEVEVADEDKAGGVRRQDILEAAAEQEVHGEEYDPKATYGSRYVVPVSGFLCRLCKKFFYSEATARHTHCRTHTHFVNLQNHTLSQMRPCDDDDSSSAPT